jgi:hypothetical protein
MSPAIKEVFERTGLVVFAGAVAMLSTLAFAPAAAAIDGVVVNIELVKVAPDPFAHFTSRVVEPEAPGVLANIITFVIVTGPLNSNMASIPFDNPDEL